MKILLSIIYIIFLLSLPASAYKIQSTLEKDTQLYCGIGIARLFDKNDSLTDSADEYNDFKRFTIDFGLLKIQNPFLRYGLFISEITLKENDYLEENGKTDSNIYLAPFLFSAGIELFPFSRYFFLKGAAGFALALEINDPQIRFTNSGIENIYPGAGFLAGAGFQFFAWDNNMGRIISLVLGSEYCYHTYIDDKIDKIKYLNFYLAVGWRM